MVRIHSVDVFRVFAILAVIMIHSTPFRYLTSETNSTFALLDIIINQLARFAVPFFFVISGYFWGVKVRQGLDITTLTMTTAKRILAIYIAWCFIYLIPFDTASISKYGAFGPIKVIYWQIEYSLQNPLKFLLEGTKRHLWFLTALMSSLICCYCFIRYKLFKSLIFFAVLFYLVAVLAKAYNTTDIGIDWEFNSRNGPFFGLIFFVTGYILSGKVISPKHMTIGIITFLFGTIVHFSELYFLFSNQEKFAEPDFLFGTYFMGLGVSLTALSNHPCLQRKSLAEIGKLTLGIYAIHHIYIDLFSFYDIQVNSMLWDITYLILVFTLSTYTVIKLSKFRALRNILQ